ncbi:type II toxin-antitoxin system VapC family toxin [Methylosinus sp. Ce-a6]|uniref:type II toxin-antitoxin system VapC family toxin n=1 Tax=Methylosinus sp. Ce-a6 TaxID=2172005 RepID=UPI001358DFA0|nr:type II toxin-antitoxin system VapC family toxin [Methylosinus sp. Ce-a6]
MILDTHVVLWWMLGEPRLPPEAVETIAEKQMLFVSVASVWEFEIKSASGRLPGNLDFLEAVAALRCELLSIEAKDAVAAARLPPHHGDPFDRMIIAQARRRELTIVTHDRAFERYATPILWV